MHAASVRSGRLCRPLRVWVGRDLPAYASNPDINARPTIPLLYLLAGRSQSHELSPMPSPEASSKRARPKPKPRLKTGPSTSAGAAAPSPPVDLYSSSSATSAHRTPRKQSKTSQTDRDEDSPSWVVGAHISDDIELVETSAQARLRQSQSQSTTGSSPSSRSSSQIGEDGLDALLSERKRKEAEDEERLALEEERWMANARRQPRAPPLPTDVKGKGRGTFFLILNSQDTADSFLTI